MLALAGGPNDYAERGRIIGVLRKDLDRCGRTDSVSINRLRSNGGSVASKPSSKTKTPENFCVKPGDVILVP